MNRAHLTRTATMKTSAFARRGPAHLARGAEGAIGIHEDDDPGGKEHKKLNDDPPYANEKNNPKDHR